VQRCRSAEVQRCRVGAGAAGKKVVWLYKGAKEVQSRCRGCAEAVQRCRGSAEAVYGEQVRGCAEVLRCKGGAEGQR